MTTPPPGPDGGFFAAPIPAVPQQSYGPPGQAVPARPAADGPPPFVVSSVTSLVITGIAAAWLGLSMLALISSFSSISGGGFGYHNGLGFRGGFLLVNGALNLALVYPLLRGIEAARWAATAVCTWWLLYWLYQVTRATKAFSDLGLAPAGLGFGRLTLMATLGLLILAAWAAATGAMLWMTGSSRHFTGTR